MAAYDHVSSDDVLNIFAKFKGWGNPNGDLWFIGLEEGDKKISLSKENILLGLHEYDCEFSNYDEATDSAYRERTSTWQIESKLACELLDQYRRMEWHEFMKRHLFKSHGQTFLIELYPLPKPKFKEWPKAYQDYFGFCSLADYHKNIEEKRFNDIRDWIKKKNPMYLICFGKTAWGSYKKLFCDLKDWKIKGIFQMVMTGSQKICLTPFFVNHRMPDGAIRQLAGLLKSA